MAAKIPQSLLGLVEAGVLELHLLASGERLTSLFYHCVAESEPEHVRHLYAPLTPAEFERQLHYLGRNFRVIDYHQLRRHCVEGAPLPRRALHLSFDDGYAECCTLAAPLLRRCGLPALFFVTTDWLDNRRMFYRNKISLLIERARELERAHGGAGILSQINARARRPIADWAALEAWLLGLKWRDQDLIDDLCSLLQVEVDRYLQERRPYLSRAQLRQIAGQGFTLGAHSCSHPKLCEIEPAQAEGEIVNSARMVQELTGAAEVPFSFPFSRGSFDLERVTRLRQRHAWLGMFFDSKGLGAARHGVVNRFCPEAPRNGRRGGGPALPVLLRREYRRTLRRRLGL